MPVASSAGLPMTDVQQILCPKCHKPNLRRARFCQHCGHDVILNNAGPRYYITRVIKEGGQGAVFEAIGDDGRIYAIKQMLDRFTDPRERDEAIARFEAEAKILERLRHPRIPRVYADFKDEGYHYLAMDFVRGSDLEDIIRRERYIPEERALQWADQICDVLEYLHQQKPPIIFRDMKPSNIMIEPDGNVKLIDFGIAGVFQTLQPGAHIGTPGYAPPEQYQGLATPASDIFALGATLHHMLTGRNPRHEPPFSLPPVNALRPIGSTDTTIPLPGTPPPSRNRHTTWLGMGAAIATAQKGDTRERENDKYDLARNGHRNCYCTRSRIPLDVRDHSDSRSTCYPYTHLRICPYARPYAYP